MAETSGKIARLAKQIWEYKPTERRSIGKLAI